MEFKKVTISVKSLYYEFGNKLSDGYIKVEKDKQNKYYDLYDYSNELACMDGETVYISKILNNRVLFVNNNGDTDVYFKLTLKECSAAMTEKDYRMITKAIK